MPAGVTWAREKNEFDRILGQPQSILLALHDPNYRHELHPAVYAHFTEADQRKVLQEEATSRDIESFDADNLREELIGFYLLREVAVRAAAVSAIVMMKEVATFRDPHFFDELYLLAEMHADQTVLLMLAPLQRARTLSYDHHKLLDYVGERFKYRVKWSVLTALIFHAYGVPRGSYSDAELARWPIKELDSQLSPESFPEFNNLLRSPERTVEAFAGQSDWLLIGWGRHPHAIDRSFYHDSVMHLKNFIPKNRLPWNEQWKLIPNLHKILESIARLQLSIFDPIYTQGAERWYEKRFASETAKFVEAFSLLPAQDSERGSAPKPSPQPYGVSDRGAEILCRDWMRYLGANGATVTDEGPDGGIDIMSDRYVVQVKNYVKSVGAPEIQQHVGVAYSVKKLPLFFTSGTYTSAALQAAALVQMPLFRYSAEQGTLEGVNTYARDAIAFGLE